MTFLATLSAELKERSQFPLEDEERFNMNFVPIRRKGPTFNDFNDQQAKAALALLRASLSQEGYRKATDIMELENILIIIEENKARMADGSPMRDAKDYHLCVFGTPSANDPWGWRFEGHHISQNFFSTNGEIVASTPSFMGSNPGIVKIREQMGKEVLKLETDLGFALINSLSTDQLKTARFADKAPIEIFTTTKRKVENLEPRGISYSKLNKDQQDKFMKLLNLYVDNYQLGFARTLRKKINKAGVENLYFAWAGGLKPGVGNYYRIQGPMLLIEYDNVQNNANHVHSAVRDLTNDYAEDILREHYAKEH